MNIDKDCKRCNKRLYDVHNRTEYCDECRILVRREAKLKGYSNETYEINLNKIADKPYKLTPIYFNEHSPLKVKSYTNFLKMNWVDVLKYFNRFDELYNYIVQEYKHFANGRKQNGFKEFQNHHKYITVNLVNNIGMNQIKEDAGIKKARWTDEDLFLNINELKTKLNRMPLFNEFTKLSKITMYTYQSRLKFKSLDFDNIIKYYSSECEFQDYLINKENHWDLVKKYPPINFKFTYEDLENNFKTIFNEFMEKYDTMPSRRIFNEISNIDESVYRGRFNKSWTEICKMFGYTIERASNKSEKIVLEIIKSLIQEDYKPQQTFEWLRGVNDYPLFCDGYFPNHKLIIEFDGRQHDESVEKFGGEKAFQTLKANDQIKNELIPKHGLNLIRVSSFEPFWNNNYIKQKLIESNIILNNAI